MAHSDRLRNIDKGNIFNKEAREQEANLSEVIPDVKLELERLYPQYTFLCKSIMSKKEIAFRTEAITGLPYHIENNRAHIKPDGKILMVVIGDIFYIILVSESKKQGTNDKREKEGKEKQAQGNAIERVFKNVSEINNLLIDEDIFPYIVFGSGCDFETGSSILDRISSLTFGLSFNKIYLYKRKTKLGSSISLCSTFVRNKIWNIEETFDVCIEVASQATQYYIEKYGK